ncbi:MAG: hypothetical protein EOO99_05660 [Pedobacter sp.]|nr:MAG: hypothetical protein EOO99_05660 [Pedobacter sp.]
MKHFVAISIVFFSLTQLARAERADTFRVMAEAYQKQSQISVSRVLQVIADEDDAVDSYFLSAGDLAKMTVIQGSKRAFFPVQSAGFHEIIVLSLPLNKGP